VGLEIDSLAYFTRAVIERILPSEVASADTSDDFEDVALFPEEEAIVDQAGPSRRQAFATGRACARRALAELGMAPVGIPRLVKRAPRWPHGVVGSITHCEGYRGAAVAWAREFATVGIDAEPNGPLPRRVLRRVASATEEAELASLAEASSAVSWDRLLFSAKESTYKAWFPLTGAWLGFKHAEVTIDATAGTFKSRLLVPGPTLSGHELRDFAGRWLSCDGLLITAIVVLGDTTSDI
jgi:4'-phosphopantetheinyl transferase EntD